ncbi:MAG: GTP pyrophosphokinase [Magnetococcales bacterium]|nr:GTP pyrophosphokinase [Magnetococcales bacterium]
MPTMATLLEKAIALAVAGHAGQVDKANVPYILHPLRLMLRMKSERAQIVAVLHDLIEDTDATLDDLRNEGFPEEILVALDHLTHREEESYEAYIQRIKKNILAQRVKLQDLEDNMDIRRLEHLPGERDWQRLKKYRLAWSVLNDLPEGE